MSRDDKTSRVLVTGATTPIGRALIEALLADEHIEAVLAVGREHAPRSACTDPRLHYEAVDLTRTRSLRSLLYGPARSLGISSVIHTVQHPRARDGGRRVRRINVELTRELVHVCERHPDIRRFVMRSDAAVYEVAAGLPDILREDSPLALRAGTPQWIRDRVEADLCVSSYLGSDALEVVVLRCAECFAAESGSQLFDYLDDWICLRPLGFDPMLNLLSIADLVEALRLGLRATHGGVFNIPGADTLPLSRVISACRRRELALPGPLLEPLYELRARVRDRDFHYGLNRERLHFSAILDGSRAARMLGYRPRHRLPELSG